MGKKLNKTELAIMNAAQNVFAKYGFQKTAVDDIAREAHIAKSSIYRYFKSKEDIFQTIAEREATTWKKKIKKAIDAQDDPMDKLRMYVLTKMQVLKDLANFYSVLKDEYLEHYVFIEKMRKKYVEEDIKLVEKILKIGVKQGVFGIKDLKLTAFAIVTSLKGLEYPLIAESRIANIEEGIENLLQILFNGIAKR